MFSSQGYALFQQVLSEDTIAAIARHVEADAATLPEHHRHGQIFAMRDVFATCAPLLAMACADPLRSLAARLAGSDVRPTKATFFDKRLEANWTLPLHQDLTITVAAQADVTGYTHWSIKAGVPHVQPPVAILEQIVALRIHLDDCSADNGALDVVPGSHLQGRIAPEELRRMHNAREAVCCPAKTGDILAMRPLLVHGSRKAEAPTRRRVLHVEYCGAPLDAPLEWPVWKMDRGTT